MTQKQFFKFLVIMIVVLSLFAVGCRKSGWGGGGGGVVTEPPTGDDTTTKDDTTTQTQTIEASAISTAFKNLGSKTLNNATVNFSSVDVSSGSASLDANITGVMNNSTFASELTTALKGVSIDGATIGEPTISGGYTDKNPITVEVPITPESGKALPDGITSPIKIIITPTKKWTVTQQITAQNIVDKIKAISVVDGVTFSSYNANGTLTVTKSFSSDFDTFKNTTLPNALKVSITGATVSVSDNSGYVYQGDVKPLKYTVTATANGDDYVGSASVTITFKTKQSGSNPWNANNW